MKRMKWGIIPLLICLLFTACKDDEIVGLVEEGLPVSLNMNMIVPGPSDVHTQTRATDEVETNVEKLALFFYKYEDSKPNILDIPTNGLKKTEQPGVGSSTNYFYKIEVTAKQMSDAGILSGEYWVYGIANWNKGFCAVDSATVKELTRKQLEEYCVLKTNNLIDLNETALLLTGRFEGPNGEEKITLNPGNNVLKDFHLKRITAKIIFNFENGQGANFIPTGYEIYNYSRSSTLIERKGWTDKSNQVNDKMGTFPGSLSYKGSNDAAAFNSTNGRVIPLSPKPSDRDYNFYFYMLENVQPAKNTITAYAERERRVSPQDKTFLNAPDKGTYVIVHGKYNGRRGGTGSEANDQVQGFVSYTIHLGDCSLQTGLMDNFTVRRNVKYKYNITVNGVNSIIVEATTDQENQPGAEGDILKSNENVYYLDAHFETVLIKLPSQAIDKYSLLAHTPYGLFEQQNVDPGEDGSVESDPQIDKQYLSWVKFAAPEVQGRNVVFKAYPGDANVIDIYDLLDEINAYKNGESAPTGGWHFIDHQNNIYVTAYVDEYYYDEETDLSKFINAPDRRLALSDVTKVSADGGSTYTERPIFAINQKSIQSVFNMKGKKVLRAFGAESYEETEDAQLSSLGPGREPSTVNDPRPNWGWRNLWEQLHGYDYTDPNFRWDTYVDPAKNGHLASNASVSDALKINPMQTNYNYALYQCFTRNRDEDGDGMIDVEEMKWYLPAIDECMAFWNGAAVLSDDVKFNNTALYFTSTNGTFRTWWALEGSATGQYKPDDAPQGKQRVRCIRTIGKYGVDWGVGAPDDQPSASIADYDAATRTISMHDMGEGTVRTSGSQRGEYNEHNMLGTENKLPEAFQFARENLSYRVSFFETKNTFTHNEVLNGNVCQRYYSEEANQADLGQWRIPNQRELTLIHRYFRTGTVTDESSLTDYTAARTYYQRDEGKALYFVQTGRPDFITTTWYPNNTTQQNRFSNFRIRCVRDVAPRNQQ